MNNKILQESRRIKEIMGIKSQIMSEGKIPAKILTDLLGLSISLTDDVQDSLKRAFPDLARNISVDIDDVVNKIKDMDSFDNTQIKSLLKIPEANFSNAILDILSDDDSVKQAVDLIRKTPPGDPEYDYWRESLLREFEISDLQLDNLIKKTEQKLDSPSIRAEDIAKRRQEIRVELDSIRKIFDDLNLDRTTLKELFRDKSVTAESALNQVKNAKVQFEKLTRDPEFSNTINRILSSKNYKNTVFEIEEYLRRFSPNIYKKYWIKYNGKGKLLFFLALCTIVGISLEIADFGIIPTLKEAWFKFKRVMSGKPKGKTYINDQTGFQQFLTDEQISFDSDTAAWNQTTGSWMVDIFNQSSRQYIFKDGTFEPRK